MRISISKQHNEAIYGIHEVYRPPAPIEPEVDIVAVHGMNGGALKTWTTTETGICWLNNPRFLPRYVRNARVLVWGYNASFSSLTGDHPSPNRIHHHAHTLVANLAADRRLSGTADKPIIFLCHSLGGIVVKRALTYAQTQTGHRVSHEYSIFSCTHGILFFGTPHLGTSKASYLSYLQKLMHTSTLGRRGRHSRKSALVAALEAESETLQNINDYFVPLMRNLRIFYLYETLPTPLFRTIPFLKNLTSVLIVPQSSAAPAHDDATERAGLAADHRGMVRFETPCAPGFRVVAEAVVRYCEEAVALRSGKNEGKGGGYGAGKGEGYVTEKEEIVRRWRGEEEEKTKVKGLLQEERGWEGGWSGTGAGDEDGVLGRLGRKDSGVGGLGIGERVETFGSETTLRGEKGNMWMRV